MMINEQTTIGTNNSNSTPPLFSSSLDMRIHPLSSSPANNAFFQTGNTLPLTDDVTTIFVVGFPDDMTEREFQNMFMFCRGFEAASLKWHCKDQDDDTSVGSNSGKKQMIGFAKFRTRLEAMEAVEILSGKKVDQDKGTILKAEMAKKNLHVKRGSVAPTVNPLLPSSTLIQQQSASTTSSSLPPLGSPTSSITPPLTAAVVPNGGEAATSSSSTKSAAAAAAATQTETKDSAVDPATGDPITSSSSPAASSTPTSSSIGGGKQHSLVGEGTMSLLSKKLGRYPTNASSSSSSGSYDAFSPLPSDLLSPADYKTDPFLNEQFACSTPTTPIFSDSLFGNMRSNSFDGRQPDIGLMSPPRHFGNSNSIGIGENNNNNNTGVCNGGMMGFNQQGNSSGSNSNNNNSGNSFMLGPSPLAKASHFSSHHHPLHHHSLQQQHPSSHHPLQQHHPLQNAPPYPISASPFNNSNNNNNDDPFNYLSKSTPVSNDQLFGTSPLFDNLMASRMGSLTMQVNNITDLRSPSVSSIQPPSVPPHHRPSNPADQNPPCNTLYVGNLPPNTNEDELRQLFSQCRGYKRMCFRNKPQGPMCFVEFDDVVLATHALNEHQGHCLTTSIKGGIRLSFSKNPLFIKGPGGGFFAPNNTTTTTTTGQQ